MQTKILTKQRIKEQQIKHNINFFIQHIPITELEILENLALKFAIKYYKS